MRWKCAGGLSLSTLAVDQGANLANLIHDKMQRMETIFNAGIAAFHSDVTDLRTAVPGLDNTLRDTTQAALESIAFEESSNTILYTHTH